MSAIFEISAKGFKSFLNSIHKHIFERPMDFLRVSIPAILYLVQNTLLFVALSNLAAPTFQILYQSKLLTTAVVSAILLKRKYVIRQWICLVILGMGVSTVVLGEASNQNKGSTVSNEADFVVGLLAVLTSCFSLAFAGVYFEKVLKKNHTEKEGLSPPSLWIRNIQLAFFSICIGALNIWRTEEEKSFMHGFSPLVDIGGISSGWWIACSRCNQTCR